MILITVSRAGFWLRLQMSFMFPFNQRSRGWRQEEAGGDERVILSSCLFVPHVWHFVFWHLFDICLTFVRQLFDIMKMAKVAAELDKGQVWFLGCKAQERTPRRSASSCRGDQLKNMDNWIWRDNDHIFGYGEINPNPTPNPNKIQTQVIRRGVRWLTLMEQVLKNFHIFQWYSNRWSRCYSSIAQIYILLLFIFCLLVLRKI